jgi:phospholipase C
MTDVSRRSLLASLGATALAALPPAIGRAAMIAPDVRTGSIKDVAHIVILMQENRGFDHYFGTMRGVRGFGDRHPIPLAPLAGGASPRDVWHQLDRHAAGGARQVAPFHLATRRDFELMRMEGTPHSWPDAQAAWDEGRMAHWPEAKSQRAMGHYRREDIPFQFALAEAFTICDAYHCSIQTGTNSNRLFLWSGTNDPGGTRGGPAIGNSHDSFPEDGGAVDPYRWTTTVERLQAIGVDWRIYQDMADNFTDNPLVGFAAFRNAQRGVGDPALKERALTTRGLDALRADVLAGKLPQVSYIVATAKGSEHPGPSSPAQGAVYTADVLDALTADPAVWARTALFVMFDENDGFFDHVPPPAPPSRDAAGELLGGSTVDVRGEYHDVPSSGDAKVDVPQFRGRPYGLGPRVPMYVVSPWSRGGWVNSQVFDHTSVIRFLEQRFDFRETNISAWRRAICGDLTSAFDFTAASREAVTPLPNPRADATRAAALRRQVSPDAPADPERRWQEPGTRRSRPLPYRLDVVDHVDDAGVRLRFSALPGAGAVFHVYDRNALDQAPRRYTVAAGKTIEDRWAFDPEGDYDLWVLAPNGFHRSFAGSKADRAIAVQWRIGAEEFALAVPATAANAGLTIERGGMDVGPVTVRPGRCRWSLEATYGWYDVKIRAVTAPRFFRRLAGRIDVPRRASVSEPFFG